MQRDKRIHSSITASIKSVSLRVAGVTRFEGLRGVKPQVFTLYPERVRQIQRPSELTFNRRIAMRCRLTLKNSFETLQRYHRPYEQ